MLTRIFGLHGTGKSEYLYGLLEKCIQEKKQAFLIVPEQQAVSAERALIERLGNPANMYIEVINFKRLCNRVFRECGGVVSKTPDTVSKQLAMSHVLSQFSDMLKEYSALSDDADFALKMLGTVEEMHRYRVSPEMLEKILPDIRKTSESLYNKLCDVLTAYRGYEAYISNALDFPGDLLDKLYETLCEFDFFKGKAVFLDSFYGFTAQEQAIIEKIIASADKVCITFLCRNEKDDNKCFVRGMSAAKGCKKSAGKFGIAVEDIYLEDNKKHTSSPALKKVSGHFSLDALCEPAEQNDIGDGVSVFCCEDLYSESILALKLASDLITNGAKPREIAICARNTQEYSGIIDSYFKNAGIPFSFDKKTDLSATPVAALVSTAFDVYFSWSANSVINYMKTGLSGISDSDADMLDLYIRTWNISGKRFFHETWYMNPAGLIEKEPDKEVIDRIALAKEQLIAPLDSFCESLDKAKTPEDIAKAVYALTYDIALSQGRETLDDTADGEYLDLLYRLLDSISESVGKETMAVSQFYKLFRSIIKNMSVGKIPELLDEVRFLPVTLMRTDAVKYVILLGANDGVFPAKAENADVFKDSERQKLKEAGIELADLEADLAYDEIFLAYTAICSASEKAFVLYRKKSVLGEELYPSVIVNIILRMLGKKRCDFEEKTSDYAISEDLLFDRFLTLPDGKEKTAVYKYLSENGAFLSRIQRAEKADEHTKFLSDKNIKALYGNNMLSSYSRLEKYRQCPFMYFCSYTLKISPVAAAKLGAIETGNVVHKALEHLIPIIAQKVSSQKEMTEQEVASLIKEELEKILDTLLPHKGTALTKRLQFLFSKLERTLNILCNSLVKEMEVSRFVPTDFELAISPDGEIKPAVIPLNNGKTLSIVGSIDRVDLYNDTQTNASWVRITDYKTGSKAFKLEDIHNGFNLQMLLYLYTLVKNGSGKYKNVLPAGVLYKIANPQGKSVSLYDASADGYTEKLENSISGLVVEDAEIIFAMDKTGSGKYTPVKLSGKSLKDTKDAAMPLDELCALLEEAAGTAAELAIEISHGNKTATPFESSSHNPCDYCEVRDICPSR